MIFIQCTKKLLCEPLPSINLKCDINNNEFLGNFHANLFKIGRKKCVLFTNNNTLFSFTVMPLIKKDFENLDKLFLEYLILNLNYEGLEDIANKVKDKYLNHLLFTKTNNACVLGSMNDFIRHASYWLYHEYGMGGNTLFMNQKLNDIPMKAIGYDSPKRKLIKMANSINQ